MSDQNLVSDTRHGKHRSPKVSIVVSDTILDRLGRLAEVGGFTVSDTIRFCIEHTLPKLEEKYQSRERG